MITKIEYIHNNKPLDVYKVGTPEPIILPASILSINFFQDIYVPSIEGEILFNDPSLYNLFPLKYDDKIRIYSLNPKYNSEKMTYGFSKEYYVEFRIISASMINTEPNIADKDNYKQFVLSIIDDSSYDCYLTRISNSYNSQTLSEIVSRELMDCSWKTVKVSEKISKDLFELTLPKWSVYHKLSYLSKFTESSNGSGCVYFSSLPLYIIDGKSEYQFNYTTISELFNNKESFISEEYSLTSKINRIFNVLLDKDANLFDTINNGVTINDKKMAEIFRPNKLNSFLPIQDAIDNTKYNQSRQVSPWKLNYFDNYLMKNLIDCINMYCTVSGDFKRKIGTVIDLKFPSGFEALNKRDYSEKEHSGKYLIKSMEHIITKDEDNQWVYNQKLGLITDGYNNDEFKIYRRNN